MEKVLQKMKGKTVAENQMMKNITMSVSPGDVESSANRCEVCGEGTPLQV